MSKRVLLIGGIVGGLVVLYMIAKRGRTSAATGLTTTTYKTPMGQDVAVTESPGGTTTYFGS